MNQYLLLRDNKQTGPYTAEELAVKGLKAYDLVWLEGKSAAWRYPSELAELKPFAPVVEEQPYDRFYKKTVEEPHPLLDKARITSQKEHKQEIIAANAYTPVQEVEPVQEQQAEEIVEPEEIPAHQEPVLTIHPKKIYVTLPASNGKTAKKETKKAAASFSQNISPITEERSVNEVKKKQEAVAIAVNETFSEFDKTTDKDLYSQLQENKGSRPKRKSSARPVMFSLIAACLLLFGVIIGLYINNNKQQSQNKALEDLVKQIQEREISRQTSAPVTPVQEPTVNEMQQAAIDSSNVLNNETKEPAKKLPTSTVSRKGNGANEKQQPLNTIPAGAESEPIANNNPPQEENKEKETYKQASLESARKNIHQLLLVESSKFKTGVLGGISNLHMTISNNSRFPLDQVAIEIKYFGPEQKLVKTQTLLFNDLAPGEQKTLEAPRTSRGVTIDYAITRINSKVLGLAQQTQF